MVDTFDAVNVWSVGSIDFELDYRRGDGMGTPSDKETRYVRKRTILCEMQDTLSARVLAVGRYERKNRPGFEF